MSDTTHNLLLIAAWHTKGGPTPEEPRPDIKQTCEAAHRELTELRAKLAERDAALAGLPELIENAHMAGQQSAGWPDPSYSEALAYRFKATDSLPAAAKRDAEILRAAEALVEHLKSMHRQLMESDLDDAAMAAIEKAADLEDTLCQAARAKEEG